MSTLRCTQKLIKALGKSAEKLFSANPDNNDTSILRSWNAHLVIFSRLRFVLFVNEKTLQTVFIHLKPKENLLPRFQQALFKELLRLKIPVDKATEEALKFQNFTLEENTDKSMASYMNQMAFEYKFLLAAHIEERKTFEIGHAQELVNRTPRIKREHVFPDDYVRELLGVARIQRSFRTRDIETPEKTAQ